MTIIARFLEHTTSQIADDIMVVYSPNMEMVGVDPSLYINIYTYTYQQLKDSLSLRAFLVFTRRDRRDRRRIGAACRARSISCVGSSGFRCKCVDATPAEGFSPWEKCFLQKMG